MKISTRGRYAMRAMLDLALQSSDGPTMIKDISKRQGISCLYLEQLFTRLNNAGLIISIRGPKGGFILAKPLSHIRVSDIIQVMEGSAAPVECVDNTMCCSRAGCCAARQVWIEVKEAMDEVLESITLQDLVKWEEQCRLK